MTNDDLTPPPANHPDWLKEGITKYRANRDENRQHAAELALGRAQRINDTLKRLGITPISPAATAGNRVIPAKLVDYAWDDLGNETWAVEADWDPSTDGTMLVARGHDTTVYGSAGLLTSVQDVVTAMHAGPAPSRASSMSAANYYGIAARSVRDEVGRDTSGDADQIMRAVQGLTAAVLHLADVVTAEQA